MNDSKDHKAAAEPPLDCRVSLLPCPFCGKDHALEVITGQELMDDDQEFWQHSDSFAIICSAASPGGKGGCGAMGGFAATEQAAIERWNNRANAQ